MMLMSQKHKGDCMIKTIVKEKGITFKELEKKFIFYFIYACDLAVEMTKIVLEFYDKDLYDQKNRKEYQNKGKIISTLSPAKTLTKDEKENSYVDACIITGCGTYNIEKSIY